MEFKPIKDIDFYNYIYRMKWSIEEIEKIKTYDKLLNELACTSTDTIREEEICKVLTLEAELLIINKFVVGYTNNTIEGFYSFNEALRKEKYYTRKGKVFTFHPVNFIN